MSILAGSYERFLFGYAVQGNGDEVRVACMRPAAELHACSSAAAARCTRPPLDCRPDPAAWRVGAADPDPLHPPQPAPRLPQLKRSFTHAAHKGVVKCIAAAGQFAATGGADDLIHLYDLKVRSGPAFRTRAWCTSTVKEQDCWSAAEAGPCILQRL